MPTYRQAGVDIEAGERLVRSIADAVTSTWSADVVGGFGGFAAGIEIPSGFANPVLMMSTDGVGTKIEVAIQAGRVDGLGHDLVAMCVDDLAAVGATPIAFTDYLATGRIDAERDKTLIESIAGACRIAGCALLGGETAEHPGVMGFDQFDLAGAALGVVERGRVIDGSAIRPGDTAIGLHSPNVRSNGFSLIRSVFGATGLAQPSHHDPDHSIGWVLSEPSVIYSPAILAAANSGGVTGLAHVTGGGLPGNAGRPLPDGLGVVIDPTTWRPPTVFDLIRETGSISAAEMFKTFNMGIGFLIYSKPQMVDEISAIVSDMGHVASVVGQVTAGHSTVVIDGMTTHSEH